MLEYFIPPVRQIQIPCVENSNTSFFILREDLNHPLVSGNKWWKLKYNLQAALKEKKSIVTFGGAYSNHIYATAQACRNLGINCVGIIRGERASTPSQTILEAEKCGMKLKFITREIYKKKNDSGFIEALYEEFPDSLILPEGGSNSLALKGCKEWAESILESNKKIDHIVIAVGTGATIAGLISGFNGLVNVTGIAVLKDGSFLNQSIRNWLQNDPGKWQVHTNFHYGGYAKRNETVSSICRNFMAMYNIPLDYVYNGKMVSAVFDLASQGYFNESSNVLLIHSGGMQGNQSSDGY
jgi:1-aminocyclopropane-1-carboxylate deaminase